MSDRTCRRLIFVLPLLAFGLLAGCTSVRLEAPLLTEQNADALNLSGYYIESTVDLAGDMEESAAYSAANLGKTRNKPATRAWLIRGWDPAESHTLLARSIGNGTYLVQITTSRGKEQPSITLFYARSLAGGITAYALSDKAIQAAASDPILKPMANHVKFTKDTITFDKTAVAKWPNAIIRFMATQPEKHLHAQASYKATNDAKKVNTMWQQAKQVDATKKAKEAEKRKAEIGHIKVGSKMVYDVGFGSNRFRDVTILAIRDEQPRVEIRWEDGKTQWTYPSLIITTEEMNRRKLEAAAKVLRDANQKKQ